MRIAIAGGNGFIGGRVTAELLGAGHEVVWLSHSPGRVAPPRGVREVAFDANDEAGEWTAEVFEANAVVNLSGYPISTRWTASVLPLLRSSRLDTTRALVNVIESARFVGQGPDVFVCANACGIYDHGEDLVLTEESRTGGDWLADLGIEWERAAQRAEASQCRVVTVRQGLVLGADGGILARMVPPMRHFVGGPVGPGYQWVSWVHIADAAGLYRHAIETGTLMGPLNSAAPNPVTMREFAKILGRVLHRPSWIRVPTFALRIPLGPAGPYTVESQRMSAQKALDSGYRYRFPELEGALRDVLGRKPR